MSQAVMIDLETLSLRTDAAIISIAAYEFDTLGDDSAEVNMAKVFHINIEIDLAQPYRHVSWDTVKFWLTAPEDARRAITEGSSTILDVALIEFKNWMSFRPDATVWSHENFDIPILMTAYEESPHELPWNYRAPRDIRTIIEAAYGRNLDMEEEIANFPANPYPHHPVYDCWHQVLMVQRCFRDLSRLTWI